MIRKGIDGLDDFDDYFSEEEKLTNSTTSDDPFVINSELQK